jgi:hypothetical protein
MAKKAVAIKKRIPIPACIKGLGDGAARLNVRLSDFNQTSSGVGFSYLDLGLQLIARQDLTKKV